MSVLSNSKHERFTQAVVQGLSQTEAYISAGYAKAGARQNAQRLITRGHISARIEELQTAVAAGVVKVAIRDRNYRIAGYQDTEDRIRALIGARSVMYAGQLGEGRTLEVHNLAEEQTALGQGFRTDSEAKRFGGAAGIAARLDEMADRIKYAFTGAGEPPVSTLSGEMPEYPKLLYHPGYPNGGATGLLVKDYRGKNAEQEIFKADTALIAARLDNFKQAAIEEGQWSEKRDQAPSAIVPVKVTVVFVTPPPRDETGAIIDVQKS